MKLGDVVKFSEPVSTTEINARFVLLENPDTETGRVLVREICEMPIPRTTIFDASELVIA